MKNISLKNIPLKKDACSIIRGSYLDIYGNLILIIKIIPLINYY